MMPITRRLSLVLAACLPAAFAAAQESPEVTQDPTFEPFEVEIVTEPTEPLEELQDPDGLGEVVDPEFEASVSELEQLIAAPGGVRLREYQEDPENPASLFDSEDRIQRIFGESPRFIYFPEGVDPMIIPWVRERIVAEELFDEATVAAANRDWERALGLLQEIREEYPGTPHGQRAPQEMARVQGLREAERQPEEPEEPDLPQAPEEQQVVLPEWIANNTNGIILGREPMVIVGNDFLRVGDRVPRYSSVVVQEINESEVVYQFQNQEFAVEVVGTL